MTENPSRMDAKGCATIAGGQGQGSGVWCGGAVLFFAGVSTRIGNRRLRWVLTLAGFLVLIGAVVWISTFPVSLEV